VSADRVKFRWGLWFWFLLWVLAFVGMKTLLWEVVWVALAIIYVGAYYRLQRTNIETEVGLQKASNVLIALVGVQIAVLIFAIAFARR